MKNPFIYRDKPVAHSSPVRESLKGLLFPTLITIITLILLFPAIAYPEAAEGKTPRVSMGAGAFFGRFHAIIRGDTEEKWEGGNGYGGGLIFERMFNDRFGIHSGIWYFESSMTITSDYDDYSMEARSLSLSIPFYLITSFNFQSFALEILSGFNFTYITETYLYEGSRGSGRSTNVRPFINNFQIGLGGGVQFKYRITRFIDIFIGALGERYLTSFVAADDRTTQYLYDIRLQSGVMLRTF
jgi:hypothetical protein